MIVSEAVQDCEAQLPEKSQLFAIHKISWAFVPHTRLIVSFRVCRFPRVKFKISKIIFQKRFPISKSFVHNQ